MAASSRNAATPGARAPGPALVAHARAHRKLVRDLMMMRGQALAIALVLAAGIAMFVAYFGTFDSLERTRAAYYATTASPTCSPASKRAPLSLQARLARDRRRRAGRRARGRGRRHRCRRRGRAADRPVDLAAAATRRDAERRAPARGRDPEPGRGDEVLVNEAFASARRSGPAIGSAPSSTAAAATCTSSASRSRPNTSTASGPAT